MLAHSYRVAIARILSDLIRSDKIIEQSEIQIFNQIQLQFGITQNDRIEAQNITMTEAMMVLRDLDANTKQEVHNALLQTSLVDNQCVAREALILLALKYILEDKDGKYELLSCDTRGSYIEDKFVVYIESDEQEEVNEEIKCDIDAIYDKLRLWNFDFIYLPHISNQLLQMDENYIKDIIRYMRPKFNDSIVDILYQKLTNVTTESFTTELLGAQMNLTALRECDPSLLINFGTSIIPYCSANNLGKTYTDFLRIRLDDTVLNEIKQFIADYSQIVTDREVVRPNVQNNYFKYFGFYKALFDFLSQADGSILMDRKLILDLPRQSLWICGREIKLSPTQLTTYILILQQSIRGYGLRIYRTEAQKTQDKKRCDELTAKYRKIYASFDTKSDVQNRWQFVENTKNIAIYVARIKQKLREEIPLSPEVYIPHQKNIENGIEYYATNVNIDNVYVRTAGKEECLLKDYRPWK